MSDNTANPPANSEPMPPRRANCRSWVFDTGQTEVLTLLCLSSPSGLHPEDVDLHLEGRRNLRGLTVLPRIDDYENSNPEDQNLPGALVVTDAVLAVCGIGAPAPSPDAPTGLPRP